jgi:hypothetical protein
VFYILDVAEQPKFVAQALSKLPPMTVHEFGVGKILCEIEALKMAVNNLQVTNTGTQSEGHLPKDSACTFQPSATSCLQHKAYNSTSTQTCIIKPCTTEASAQAIFPNSGVFGNYAESTPVRPSPIPSRGEDSMMDTEDEFIVIDYTSCRSPSGLKNDSLYSDISSTSLCFNESELPSETTKHIVSPKPSSPSWAQICRQKIRTNPAVQISKNRKTSVVFGSGKCTNVKAVQTRRSVRKSSNSGNKLISGVFLSRLDPHTTSRQLQLHIKHETGVNCRPEKLKTKYSGYSSFFIRTQGFNRTTIMEPSLWPAGTLVKPFYT